ncbi:MAG TPA: hypothetical protein DCZ94_07480 [Lentisphaeria bacterium]|nr:MAG: hypothetical protein A2X48_01005 [Lentisphaerae bacterium GWF2_49_21]HBC86777.1 hypothetical protein [Lentisphaeria bacterium]
MSLRDWLNNGWLRLHKCNREDIQNLFEIVDRDIADAESGISPDWRFGIAYNAALKLCTILLYAEGYRPEKNLQHYRTIQAMPLILGNDRKKDADYLETCRTKRNTVEYDYVGGASEADANELIKFVVEFKIDVLTWLKKSHPPLSDFK